MSEITLHNEKKLVIVSGRAHTALAEEVAELLGTSLLPTTAYEMQRSLVGSECV